MSSLALSNAAGLQSCNRSSSYSGTQRHGKKRPTRCNQARIPALASSCAEAQQSSQSDAASRCQRQQVEPGASISRSHLLRSSVAALTSAAMFLPAAAPEPALAVYDRPLEDYDREKLLDQNKRMQRLNQAPDNFPGFVRQGFEVSIITGDEYVVAPSGLIYWDIVEGTGKQPQDGQQVIFNYIGYNENGRRVDSTYLQGQPARTRVGINGMIPGGGNGGFEEGLRGMREGGRRRIIVPPELGPPTGPSTFFSAKQYEVFDVELLTVQDCVRRTVVFYSDVVCS